VVGLQAWTFKEHRTVSRGTSRLTWRHETSPPYDLFHVKHRLA